MKNYLSVSVLILCTMSALGQTKTNKLGISVGGSIQHYNGNLGNSFFKFKTTCFGGVTSTFGKYLTKSFDVNFGAFIGHFGYCQTDEDAKRVVSIEQKCPGCTDKLGMGELRSLMVSGNVALKYKFANSYLLAENSKLAPYLYAGMGVNYLSDVMKRNCVNVGTHFTINGGAGVKYNFNEKWNIGYNWGIGCFLTKKVYYSNASAIEERDMDADDLKMEKRKDFVMQNSLSIGINF